MDTPTPLENLRFQPVGTCIYCGISGKKSKLGKEHIIPLSMGGKLVFRYLHEAINTPDFHARLAMLASALEAIAGEVEKGKTNHPYIKDNILQDGDLYNKIFKHSSGIRNQLLHGKRIDEEVHGKTTYNSIIYGKIVDYFNREHLTKIDKKVIGAPRTIGRSYDVWRGWLKPKDLGSGPIKPLYDSDGV
jgi:hypothetical protein